MVSNIHNSTSLFRWSKIIRHSDNQGQKLPSSKIWFFGQLWPKLTTQFSWQQKQTNRTGTCFSLFFLHGIADARLLATKREGIDYSNTNHQFC